MRNRGERGEEGSPSGTKKTERESGGRRKHAGGGGHAVRGWEVVGLCIFDYPWGAGQSPPPTAPPLSFLSID